MVSIPVIFEKLIGKAGAALQKKGKRCSEKMQGIQRETPIPKRDFNKVALKLY